MLLIVQDNYIPMSENLVLLQNAGIISSKQAPELAKKGQRLSFEWSGLAATGTPIGTTLNVLEEAGVNPVRSGHMGGLWPGEIVHGGGGKLAYNHAVLENGNGKAVLFDLNETAGMTGGDTLFWPSKRSREGNGGNMDDLPLYTWNGSEFAQSDSSQPLFVPLVMTEVREQMMPLSLVQRQDLRQAENYQHPIRFISDVVMENADQVRTIFRSLLAAAIGEDDPHARTQLLRLISDRTIHLDGRVVDAPIRLGVDNTFGIGSEKYSIDQAVELLLAPFDIAAHPEKLLNLESLAVNNSAGERVSNPSLARISKELLIVLYGVLNTDNSPRDDAFFGHYHYGGIDMAGAPPLIQDYYSKSVSGVRTLMMILKHQDPEMKGMYSVLIPAAAFLLCPSASVSDDVEAMADLLHDIHTATSAYKPTQGNLIVSASRTIVDKWRGKWGSKLSPQMLSRFGVQGVATVPENPAIDVSEEFMRLGWNQAAITVGTLIQKFQNTD